MSARRNSELLKKELEKSKPKPDVVRELVKRTLKTRRDLVIKSTPPEEILEAYPHLRKATYVGNRDYCNRAHKIVVFILLPHRFF